MSEALMVALTPKLGRAEAQRLVEEVAVSAREQGRTLQEAAADNERVRSALTPEALDRALDPNLYLGSAGIFIDRALESYRALGAPR
jgi:3-carboxy-cis,cis-muconate cycloisomerase